MKKFFKRIFSFVLLVVFVVIAIVIYQGYLKYKVTITETPLEIRVEKLKNIENYTFYEDIPARFIEAVVAVEDRRFYKHSGFDVIGTGRALIRDIKNMELLEGGSTITQQLAKNMYFPANNSPWRKVAEIFLAKKIEEEYTKAEILEMYFNIIYYGKGCYNIHDAADTYFDKLPIEMNDYECTLLAGIPNAPSVYSKNKELARERQEKVLKSMVQAEYITQEEMYDILDEE